MKNFSNTYIFTFSAIMVTAVAALLAIVSLALKPKQDKNVELEKMQNILASVQVESTAKNADELYQQYITESFVISPTAEKLSGIEAFTVDMKKELAKIDKFKAASSKLEEVKESPFRKFLAGFINFKAVDRVAVQTEIDGINAERQLPVYICSKEGNTYYVLPLQGKGLWGPIWGYVALEDDMNTIYGAVFDHKSETPGLGADINKPFFQDTFKGKKLYTETMEFNSIEIVKGGAPADALHKVDGISGGTITSKGVEAMLYDCLVGYQNFFDAKRN